MALPEGRRGQLAALGLLLGVLWGLWMVLAAPLLGIYQDRANDLAEQRVLEAHMASLAASLPKLRAQAAVSPERHPSVSFQLAGSTDALAAANLQSLVGKIAQADGIAISSIDTVTPANTAWGRKIGVSIRISGSYRAIVSFVARLLLSQPKMVIDDLEIHDGGSDGGARIARLTGVWRSMGFGHAGRRREGIAPPYRRHHLSRCDRRMRMDLAECRRDKRSPRAGVIANLGGAGSPIAAMGADALAARILDRPLFLVGRHVIPPPPPPPVVVSQKSDPLPRLTGIFLAAGEKIAIFQVAGQLTPLSVEIGGRVSD